MKDMELMVASFRFTEKVAAVSPLKDIIESRTVPPMDVSKDEDLRRQAFLISCTVLETGVHNVCFAVKLHPTGVFSE